MWPSSRLKNHPVYIMYVQYIPVGTALWSVREKYSGSCTFIFFSFYRKKHLATYGCCCCYSQSFINDRPRGGTQWKPLNVGACACSPKATSVYHIIRVTLFALYVIPASNFDSENTTRHVVSPAPRRKRSYLTFFVFETRVTQYAINCNYCCSGFDILFLYVRA